MLRLSNSSQILCLGSIDITISLRPLSVPVREGETFPVCAELTLGSLERSINVILEAVNNTARRMCIMTSH